MLIGLAAETFGQTLLEQLECRARLVTRQAHCPIQMDQVIFVLMFRSEVEILGGKLFQALRRLHGRKHGLLRPPPQTFQNFPFVPVPLIHRGRRRLRRSRHAAHCQGFFAALYPQLVRRIQNAAFECGIGFARHRAVSRRNLKLLLSLRRLTNDVLYTVFYYTPSAPWEVKSFEENCEGSCNDSNTASPRRPGVPWPGKSTPTGSFGTPLPIFMAI